MKANKENWKNIMITLSINSFQYIIFKKMGSINLKKIQKNIISKNTVFIKESYLVEKLFH